MRFLKKANLPEMQVGTVCVNHRCSENIKNELTRLGISIIESPPADQMTSPVKNHADIVLHHLEGNRFVSEPSTYQYFKDAFPEAEIICGKKILKDSYPDDCFYNVARISDDVFMKVADDFILDFDNLNYTKKIYTRQGYCKCNICVVSEKAFITSDIGICKAGQDNGFDVLKIREGYIDIDGYEYGFIGGASGLVSDDTMVFCGDVLSHPDSERIKSFLRNYNIYIQCLSKEPLTDIGSVIPIAYN